MQNILLTDFFYFILLCMSLFISVVVDKKFMLFFLMTELGHMRSIAFLSLNSYIINSSVLNYVPMYIIMHLS